MSILGNVETGWFAQLSHGVENVGRFFGLGGYYDATNKYATARVESINQAAIDRATQAGATDHQALSYASGEMNKIADPSTFGELGNLFAVGGGAMKDSINEIITPETASQAMPLLIGAGILGAGYLAIEAFSGSSTPSLPNRAPAHRAAR